MRYKSMIARMIGLTVLLVGSMARAEGNIDPTEKFVWSENAGWINFASTHGGVTVKSDGLSGYAWAENIGWIKLAANDSTYANTTKDNWGAKLVSGALQGYAWSENAGWINFAPTHGGVTLSSGRLYGYAWGENVGWIHFRNENPAYGVRTTFMPGTVILIR